MKILSLTFVILFNYIIKGQNKEVAVVINHLYDGEVLNLIIHTLLVIIYQFDLTELNITFI